MLDSWKQHLTKSVIMDLTVACDIVAFDRGALFCAAEAGRVRHEVVELAADAGGDPRTRRRDLWGSPLQPRLHRSQRRGLILQRAGFPWLAQGLSADTN